MSYNKGLINGLGDSQLVKNELVHLSPQNNENNLEINTSIKTETYDEYETNLTLENITISSLKLEIKDEFTESSVILATEKVIIKEELNIDEVLCDEPTTNLENWDENDPLAILPTSHNQKFSCEICFKNFTQNRDLTSHLFIIHRPLTLTGNGAYCNKCEKWLPETKYPNHIPCFKYMRSIQSGKRIYSCQICDKDFAPIRSFQDHLIEKHRPLIAHESVDISDMKITNKTMCRICNAFFARKNALVNHLTLMHRPYTISGEGAYCTRCQSWFPEHNFKDHRPCVIPLPDKIEIFNCSICGAYFQLANLLETHMWVIHRPLTLQYCSDAFCDKCNRWFKEENYLMHKCFRRTTENITNSTAKSYMCIICYKHFESETDIKKHLFNMHRPVVIAADCFDKIFCDVCTKCYDEDKFEMHVPCHSVDSKCVFCLMAMPSKEHFLEHDLTWKGWRSYQCNICDLSTHDMRLADLYEHMICHGKKGVFRCVKCKYDYVSTKMLEAHIQCVHLGCLCDTEPCICFTFNYDYYYEFLKQRNMLGVNENLLENDIIAMREEQYNLVESNIEVWHMKKANIKENNDYSIFIPSTSKATIMEDFSSKPSETSKTIDVPQFGANYRQQEIKPKNDSEKPTEIRKHHNKRRKSRLKNEKVEPNFDFINVDTPETIPTAFIPEVTKTAKKKPDKYMRKKGDDESHEIFLARRRVYMQNYRRMKRLRPNTEEENEEEAAEKRARLNEKIRLARQKREARMSREELLQRRAVKAEKVRLRRQMQREQLSEEELSQIRAIEATRKRLKRRQLSEDSTKKIKIKCEKTDDLSTCLINDENQIVKQLRKERVEQLQLIQS